MRSILICLLFFINFNVFARANSEVIIKNQTNRDITFTPRFYAGDRFYDCYKNPGPRQRFTIKAKQNFKFSKTDSNSDGSGCYGKDKKISWFVDVGDEFLAILWVKRHRNKGLKWHSYALIEYSHGTHRYNIRVYCTYKNKFELPSGVIKQHQNTPEDKNDCSRPTWSKGDYVGTIIISDRDFSNFSK